MAFKITARTILELGAELISSDGVALYELIKNAIDAGSRRVHISVQVVLTHSSFLSICEDIETHPGTIQELKDEILDALSDVNEELLSSLDQELSDVHTRNNILKAFKEWYKSTNWIKVIDTGHGMSKNDLQDIYLTIGTRSRLTQKLSIQQETDKRVPLGEKGVGRLSTMRLGEYLYVRTSREGEIYYNDLKIDWSRFSHSSDALLHEIVLIPERGEKKLNPAKSGTIVEIGNLKSDWSLDKFRDVIAEEFSRLVDPWESRTANNILRLTFNNKRIFIPEIDRRYLELAHGTCTAKYYIEGLNPYLEGSVNYKLRGKSLPFKLNVTELISTAKVGSSSQLRSVGSFDLEMWWFNRRLLTEVTGLGKKKEITAEINKWSGGLMLFRDGFRVNPYGGADDDWLELDKKAFSSKGFKLNRQQVVGRVKISWQNKGLIDQTNREGLMDTPEKSTFIKLLQHVLLNEFKSFLDREDKAVRVQERTTFDNLEDKIESAQEDIKQKLRLIEKALPPEDRRLVKQASSIVDELVKFLDEAKALGKEYAEDRAQLVYLAGIGLMVEFIMHELERATSATLRNMDNLNISKLEPSVASAIDILSDQLSTLHKRVANFDPISTSKRQTKESFEINEVLQDIIASRKGQMSRHRIKIELTSESNKILKIKAVKGMFIQIIDNLLSNSIYWLKCQSMLDHKLIPVINIDIDTTEKMITFTDNGPGIDPAMAEQIFQPFVTRKPAGEGRGLGLYISREIADYHDWTLDLERASTVHSDRYNTFVLDFGRS